MKKSYFVCYDTNDMVIWGIGENSSLRAIKDGRHEWKYYYGKKEKGQLTVVQCTKKLYEDIRDDTFYGQKWSIQNNIGMLDCELKAKDVQASNEIFNNNSTWVVTEFANPELNKGNEEMLSLIDGAYDIVELYKAKSPAQKKWKQEWLKKARKFGAGSDFWC